RILWHSIIERSWNWISFRSVITDNLAMEGFKAEELVRSIVFLINPFNDFFLSLEELYVDVWGPSNFTSPDDSLPQIIHFPNWFTSPDGSIAQIIHFPRWFASQIIHFPNWFTFSILVHFLRS